MHAVRDKITQKINDFRCLLMNPVFSKLLSQKRKQWFRNRVFSQNFERDAEVIRKTRVFSQDFERDAEVIRKTRFLFAKF